MTLAAGTRIGSYEIVSALGAGGMGEVYRARDARLNRQVALKVLPELFASDPDRLARFEREAQVLAALNHPNIAHVYGVEDGALVMELVEGEDLAQRVARGALPVEDALPIAKQIAEALEAAHECGIVHRDLKPANIKLRHDGVVKVLDFGLAKALEPLALSGAAPIANSPTFTSPVAMTQMGLVLGTAAYMAPEQAKGKPIDRRADIWAFGVVLYEMLAARQLFAGETVAETLAGVLRAEIDWTALPSSTPARLRTLMQRCLERDPKQRLQAIGEARILIERQLADPSEGGDLAACPRSRARQVAWIALGAAAIAAVALSATLVWRTQSRANGLPVRKFFITSNLVGGIQQREFAISPDGRRVVFVSARKLYVRDLDELRPRELKGAGETGLGEAGPFPFWSPDGQSIGYANGGRLWRMSAVDGGPSVVCNLPGSYAGGAWQPDGTIVFATTRGPMYQVSALGGDARVLISLGSDDVDFHQPSLLPQGKGIMYAVHRRTATDTIEVLASGVRKVVWRTSMVPRAGPQLVNLPGYSPTGHIVYRQEEGTIGIWAVPFDVNRLERTGEPFLIVAGGANPSVAADGTLVYAPTSDAAPGQLAWLRPDGTVDSVVGEPKLGLKNPALSPDGRRIAFVASENNNDEIWVAAADGNTTRVTFTPGNESHPVWMPDGKTLVFTCDTDQGAAICAKAVDGSGAARVLMRRAGEVTVSPDGRHLVYQMIGETARGLMVQQADSAGSPRPFKTSPVALTPLGFSPDGRYVIYSSYASGEPRIYVGQFPAGDGQWELPDVRGERGVWTGHEVIVATNNSREFSLVSVPIDTGNGLSFGKARALFTVAGNSIDLYRGFAFSPGDRKTLAVKVQSPIDAPAGIVVVQNWLAEFTR